MIEQPHRAGSRSDTVLFALCLILATGLMFAPTHRTAQIASGIRSTVLLPLLWMQQVAEEGKASRSRLATIRAQRDSIARLAQSLPALRDENEQLRRLIGLGQRVELDFVPAEVLHQATPTDGLTLLLGAGSADGVAPFQPVVSPEGLLGVISSVDLRSSVAVTWAHPEFRASALTEGGGVFGIVAPSAPASSNETILELRGVPYRDTIPEGTLVMTSGLGGVYPKGIPIGTVLNIARELTGWERTYLVRPAANPGRAAHALILTGPAALPVEGAFSGESNE
ncbi:MAG: rod shape-determining protein MreC [Gemmatimonadales bacterium]